MSIGNGLVLRKPKHPQRLQERHKFVSVDDLLLWAKSVVVSEILGVWASCLEMRWSTLVTRGYVSWQWRNLQQYYSESCLKGSVRKWLKDLGTKKLVVRNFLCSRSFQVNDFIGQGLQCSEPIPDPEVYQESSAIYYHFRSLFEVCGLVEWFVSLLSAVKSSLVLHLHFVVLRSFWSRPSTVELSIQEHIEERMSCQLGLKSITWRFETLLHHCWLQCNRYRTILIWNLHGCRSSYFCN